MVMCSIIASKLKNLSVEKVILECSIEWVVQKVRKQGTVLLQWGFDRILQSTVLLLQIKVHLQNVELIVNSFIYLLP